MVKLNIVNDEGKAITGFFEFSKENDKIKIKIFEENQGYAGSVYVTQDNFNNALIDLNLEAKKL